MHLHVTCDLIKKSRQIENPGIRDRLNTEEGRRNEIKRGLKDYEERVKHLQEIQKIVIQTGGRFALFLRAKAIMAYCGHVRESLQFEIDQTLVEIEICKDQRTCERLKEKKWRLEVGLLPIILLIIFMPSNTHFIKKCFYVLLFRILLKTTKAKKRQ